MFVADLHLHSRYSYACSRDISLESQSYSAQLKGLDLISTADFTHPGWLLELETNLVQGDEGLHEYRGVKFLLGTEVNCVFRKGNTNRRIHVLIFMPDFGSVHQVNEKLQNFGDLSGNGRPDLKICPRDLVEMLLGIHFDAVVIPAHIWTPWYGLYGSKFGFDDYKEAFCDMSDYIYAFESGLSSHPAMNWGISGLTNKTIVSFSDAHSSVRMGREFTVFDAELNYKGFVDALKNGSIAYTGEFYSEEGKYHYDGHRRCGISQHPNITAQRGPECRVCHKSLTLGVLNRVIKLSNNNLDLHHGCDGFITVSNRRPAFINVIPLRDIISEVIQKGPNTKAVNEEYLRILSALGSEIEILVQLEEDKLIANAGEDVATMIMKCRMGTLSIEPGFDGVYGKITF